MWLVPGRPSEMAEISTWHTWLIELWNCTDTVHLKPSIPDTGNSGNQDKLAPTTAQVKKSEGWCSVDSCVKRTFFSHLHTFSYIHHFTNEIPSLVNIPMKFLLFLWQLLLMSFESGVIIQPRRDMASCGAKLCFSVWARLLPIFTSDSHRPVWENLINLRATCLPCQHSLRNALNNSIQQLSQRCGRVWTIPGTLTVWPIDINGLRWI